MRAIFNWIIVAVLISYLVLSLQPIQAQKAAEVTPTVAYSTPTPTPFILGNIEVLKYSANTSLCTPAGDKQVWHVDLTTASAGPLAGTLQDSVPVGFTVVGASCNVLAGSGSCTSSFTGNTINGTYSNFGQGTSTTGLLRYEIVAIPSSAAVGTSCNTVYIYDSTFGDGKSTSCIDVCNTLTPTPTLPADITFYKGPGYKETCLPQDSKTEKRPYFIQLTNNGSATIAGNLFDTVPSGITATYIDSATSVGSTASITLVNNDITGPYTLIPGGVLQITIYGTIDGLPGSKICNTAQAKEKTYGLLTSDEHCVLVCDAVPTETPTPTPACQPATITKKHTPTCVYAGDSFQYQIEINAGNCNKQVWAKYQDIVPANITFNGVYTSSPDCQGSISGGNLYGDFNLGADSSCTITLDATVHTQPNVDMCNVVEITSAGAGFVTGQTSNKDCLDGCNNMTPTPTPTLTCGSIAAGVLTSGPDNKGNGQLTIGITDTVALDPATVYHFYVIDDNDPANNILTPPASTYQNWRTIPGFEHISAFSGTYESPAPSNWVRVDYINNKIQGSVYLYFDQKHIGTAEYQSLVSFDGVHTLSANNINQPYVLYSCVTPTMTPTNTPISPTNIPTATPVTISYTPTPTQTPSAERVMPILITDPYSCGGTIHGKATDDGGSGIAQLRVELHQGSTQVRGWNLVNNSNGYFEVPIDYTNNNSIFSVTEGTYRVVFIARDYVGNESRGEYTAFITNRCATVTTTQPTQSTITTINRTTGVTRVVAKKPLPKAGTPYAQETSLALVMFLSVIVASMTRQPTYLSRRVFMIS